MSSAEGVAGTTPAWMLTPFDLYTAANFGCVSFVRELLSAGSNGAAPPADVNAPNRGSWTPLMYAASSGRQETAQLLLEHGADPNLRNGRGRTAAILAAMYGHHQCVALLYQHGADLEARDGRDRTALFHAALFGHCEVVQVLVDLGVNINCVEQFTGHSPKSIAAENHHNSVVEILLNAGARFSRVTSNGNTLHPVCQSNIPKTSPCGRERRVPEVESLVRRCANLTMEGMSPRPRAEHFSEFVSFNDDVMDSDVLTEQGILTIIKGLPVSASNEDIIYDEGSSVQNSCLNLPPKPAIRNLADFLGHLGLSKYVPLLESQGIDLEQFLTFGDAQLEQAGIRLIGPKRKMSIAIAVWNERERQLSLGDGRLTNLPL